ncbi:uncharacterized protein LOC122039352 [Zingiber officinale]|uniref:Uncharacterized protein n=1 Tax=Zingiber officinale TaxID=94328 RepID=A0A8J5HXB6_ZINOF|nr:uncharacterized protein LOC122039352 [Zingiber officinale]KAG6532344.1 hypothetical protein ZIOFF_006184 [Zingiber officinale]
MNGEREENSSTPSSHTSGEPYVMADDSCGRSGNDGDEEEFEFAFVTKDPEAGPEITANELFSNGQIRTIYPVFGSGLLLEAPAVEEKTTKVRGTLRRLFIEEREEDSSRASSASSSLSSSAGVDELDGIPEGTYCVWAPAPSPSHSRRGKKSGSTGSSMWWRLRELFTGRSHSAGREKIVLLESAVAVAAVEEVTEGKEEKESERRAGGVRRCSAVTASSVPVGGGPRRCPM